MKKIFEGSISCKAILEGKKRTCYCLYVDKKKRSKDFSYIIAIAKKNHVPVQLCTREQINELALGKTHGGILLEADTQEINSLHEKINGFLFYADGIEDPYNLGSVIRTLYAMGCNALILPKRDWSISETTILKASAGAYEKLAIYTIDSDTQLIDYLKQHSIPLYCAYRNNAIPLQETNFPNTFCIALGGALRGLSSKLIQASTQNIVIEYPQDFRNALDSPSAAAILAYEVARQNS